MKTVKLIFAVMMTALSLNVWAGDVEKKSEIPVRFNVRGGVSAVSAGMGNNGIGIGGNIAGYVELPLSKSNENWKVNLGLKFNNKNVSDVNSSTIPDYELTRSVNTYMFFIDVPVIFSYDFNIGNNNNLRLGFGAFYSRYAGGCTVLKENKEIHMDSWSQKPENSSTFTKSTMSGTDYIGLPDNGGLILNIGWYIKDFYIGADYEMTYDTGRADFMTALSATIGYRF